MQPTRKRIFLLLLLCVVVEYLAVFVFICSISGDVFADSFYPGAYVESSRFYTTFALGYDLASVKKEILFESTHSSGHTYENLFSLTFEQLTDKEGMYTRRVAAQDNIVAPPGANISIGVYLYNDTGHTVRALNTWLFLSPYMRPGISEVVEIEGKIYRNIAFTTEGATLTKGGQSIEFGSMGNFFGNPSGEGVAYRKVISIGEISNPITLSVSHARCSVNTRGEYGTTYEAIAANKGVATETVQLEGEPVRAIAPKSELSFTGFFVTDKQGAFDEYLVVKKGTPRCLITGTGNSSYSHVDGHALVLSRNEDLYPLWGATVLSLPSFGTQEQFCIARQEYRMALNLPVCIRLPKYEIFVDQSEVVLPAGGYIDIPFRVVNSGGTDLPENEVVIDIVASEPLRNQLEFQSVFGDGSVGEFSPLISSSIATKGLPGGGEFKGILRIHSKDYYEKEESFFQLSIGYGAEVKIVNIKPELKSTTAVAGVDLVCVEGVEILQVNLMTAANHKRIGLEVPFELGSQSIIEVVFTRGVDTYGQVFTGSYSGIVSIPWEVSSGVSRVAVSLNTPMRGGIVPDMAVFGVAANLVGECPVSETIEMTPSTLPTASLASSPEVSVPLTTVVPSYSVKKVDKSISAPIIRQSNTNKNATIMGAKVSKSVEGEPEIGLNSIITNERVSRNYTLFFILIIAALALVLVLFPRKRGSR